MVANARRIDSPRKERGRVQKESLVTCGIVSPGSGYEHKNDTHIRRRRTDGDPKRAHCTLMICNSTTHTHDRMQRVIEKRHSNALTAAKTAIHDPYV